jgi:hypothetical protein
MRGVMCAGGLCRAAWRLESDGGSAQTGDVMWNEPYLETCCRSALHRLTLVGDAGRPAGLKDGPCLERLSNMGLAALGPDGRYHVTPAGDVRHATEILKQPA